MRRDQRHEAGPTTRDRRHHADHRNGDRGDGPHDVADAERGCLHRLQRRLDLGRRLVEQLLDTVGLIAREPLLRDRDADVGAEVVARVDGLLSMEVREVREILEGHGLQQRVHPHRQEAHREIAELDERVHVGLDVRLDVEVTREPESVVAPAHPDEVVGADLLPDPDELRLESECLSVVGLKLERPGELDRRELGELDPLGHARVVPVVEVVADHDPERRPVVGVRHPGHVQDGAQAGDVVRLGHVGVRSPGPRRQRRRPSQ